MRVPLNIRKDPTVTWLRAETGERNKNQAHPVGHTWSESDRGTRLTRNKSSDGDSNERWKYQIELFEWDSPTERDFPVSLGGIFQWRVHPLRRLRCRESSPRRFSFKHSGYFRFFRCGKWMFCVCRVCRF